tara:strand:- start:1356 stop:2114 length:759 start_codon:yes stop_codon:yes gene_type:complete
MAFSTRIYADYGMEKKTGTDKYHSLGTILELPDGREFKYAKAGAVALGLGLTVATPQPTAHHDMDLVTAAAAVGATSVTVTLEGTAAAEDLYADGYIYTNDGHGDVAAGQGQVYRIAGHDTIGSSGSGAIELADNDKVAVALTSATLSGLIANPYSGVVVTPTTVLNRTCGVPATEIAASAYGWVQTKGLASVRVLGTMVVGQHIRVAGVTTAGVVETLTRAGSSEDEQSIGVYMGIVSVTTDMALVWLDID